MASAFKCDECYQLIEGDSKKEIVIHAGGYINSSDFYSPTAIKVTMYQDLCNKCIIDLLRLETKL